VSPTPLRLSPEAAAVVRVEIQRARGREVTFLMDVSPERMLVNARAVARGNRNAVLAVSRDAPQGSVMVHNHPSGDLEPSQADLAVAAALSEAGIGSAIVDNHATELYVVVEPPPPRVVVPLEEEALDAFLGPGGPLSTSHPGFEDRPGQREMAHLVARRYNEGGVGLVEAGTGTGKSMAYLLPAALWALRNRERTVVSTNTINLQEQLVGKDLPLLRRALGEEVRWALAKGRGNYVSIRRARLASENALSLFPDDRTQELEAILEWIETTEDGSLSDLALQPSDEVWEEVRSDPDICLKARCPHFQACFYQKARRAAASAEILVVNHHLLFADLAVRRATGNYSQAAVLPPYRHLVLDEAHNVEAAATGHLGVEVTRTGLFRLLSRLERRGKGLLADLRDKLSANPERGFARELVARIQDRVLPAVEEARDALDPFLAPLGSVLESGEGGPVRLGGEGGPEPGREDRILEPMATFLNAVRTLVREVGELSIRILGDDAWCESLEVRVLDLQSVQNRLLAVARGVQRVMDPGEETANLVRWLEMRGKARGGNLAMAAAPVDVGPLLRQDLFARLDTVILTSATLTTRTGFQYLRGRLGLAPEVVAQEDEPLQVEEGVVPSPFDFTVQSLLAVPTDLPGTQEPGDRLQEETARVVLDTAALTGGGLFVLFTSHRALRRVGELLREREGELPGPLFVQGEAPRFRLLQRFVESGRGILLGTASFWEGVDVPGHPLRGIVIQKLPFQVPTEPIIAARMEAIRDVGMDPFWTYTLPDAAIRLKQGFGRLVRTREDRGVVLVLDHRILTRKYGPYLRQSLPPTPLAKGPWPQLRRVLEGFYRVG
jgi:ATP-dependent DNA helicase DinG